MEIKTYTINDFSAGQCSGFNEEKIPENGVLKAENCLIDIDGTIYKYGGKRLFQSIGSNSSAYIVNHCLFKKSDGFNISVVVASDNKVYYYSSSLGEYTQLTGFASDFGNTSFIRMLSYADVLWFVDGKYVYTWDGSTLLRVDSSGSSPLLPSDFDYARLIEQSHGIIYLSGYVNNPSMVCYSKYVNDSGYFILPTDSDAWDATNVFLLPQEGQIITALGSFNDMLFIWTEDKTWVLSGYVGNTSTYLKPIFDIGCVSQETVRVVNNTLYWCAKDGIYSYNGSLNKISLPINDYFKDNITQFDFGVKNIYDNTNTEYSNFSNFVNCSYNDIENSITPSTYPYVVDHSLKLKNYDGLLNNSSITKVIQSFTTQSDYTGTYKLRIYVNKVKKGITYNVNIKNAINGSVLYSSTLDLSGLPNLNPDYYSSGFAYATFNNIQLEENTTYYIEITNANYIYFYLSNQNGWNGKLYKYYNVEPSPIYEEDTSGYKISMFLYPIESYFYTDVYSFSPANFISKINVIFDETFLNDEVDLSLSAGYTLAYRYSTNSVNDCKSKNWTLFKNNSFIEGLPIPATNFYIQFKIIMKYKNIYQDTTEWFMQKMLCKFNGIKFYVISNGYYETKKYFANVYNDKYLISLPEIGKIKNQKIFVLNNGKSWTYFTINSDCFWQYKEDLYFADNTNYNIYYLQKDYGIPIYTIDNNSELNNYVEILNMTTIQVGSDYFLGELLLNGDPLNCSDNFNDGVLDSKWKLDNFHTNNITISEKNGYLNFYKPNTIAAYRGCYQDNIQYFSNFETSIDFVGGTWSNGHRWYFNLLKNGTYRPYITAIVEKASTNNNLYVICYDEDGNYKSGITINSVVVSKIKYVRDITSNTITCYYYNGTSWVQAISETMFNNIYDFVIAIGIHSNSSTNTIDLNFDNFVFSGDYYSPTGYTIYSYEAPSNQEVQLFYSIPQIYSDQTINIYYAIASSNDFTNEYDRYAWKKIAEITQDNSYGNVSFIVPNNNIRRILIEYTDGGSSGNTFLIDYLKFYSMFNFKTEIEFPYIEFENKDAEKYLRKCYIDAFSDNNIGIYYKTEKMYGWHYIERDKDDKRISLRDEHGYKMKFKIVSENSDDFVLKHFTIYYKERNLR